MTSGPGQRSAVAAPLRISLDVASVLLVGTAVTLVLEALLYENLVDVAIVGYLLAYVGYTLAGVWLPRYVAILQAFALLAVFRLVNLAVPAFVEQTVYWLPLIYLPMIPAALLAMRSLPENPASDLVDGPEAEDDASPEAEDDDSSGAEGGDSSGAEHGDGSSGADDGDSGPSASDDGSGDDDPDLDGEGSDGTTARVETRDGSEVGPERRRTADDPENSDEAPGNGVETGADSSGADEGGASESDRRASSENSRAGVRQFVADHDRQTVALAPVVLLVAAVVLAVAERVLSDPATLVAGPTTRTSLLLAFGVGIAAVAEELLFRGLVQSAFRDYLGPASAVGLASLLFAAMQPPTTLVPLAVAITAGVVYGVAYEYTETLLAPVLTHVVVNLLVFVVLRGNGDPGWLGVAG